MSNQLKEITAVIPTFNRGGVLLDTLAYLFKQSSSPKEIIVVDQTDYNQKDCDKKDCDKTETAFKELSKLSQSNKINWLKLDKPSIPHAMNQGLLLAKSSHVLFLDDDIEMADDFIKAHLSALSEHDCPAQVGQVIQPWQTPQPIQNYVAGEGLEQDLHFPFNGQQQFEITNCMAGNLCVDRQSAIKAGGFDENFSGAAYRFETEFCRRLCHSTNNRFQFAPTASINHLYISTGGTRSNSKGGESTHLTSASPRHSAGDYYFALREGKGLNKYCYITKRFIGSLIAKFYLRKPWWLPVRFIAECNGLVLALKKHHSGAKLIISTVKED